MVEAKFVPIFSLLVGAATGFVLRDELTMPTYMRIKTATVEHRMLSRTKLDLQILKALDPNEGLHKLSEHREKVLKEYELQMKQATLEEPTEEDLNH
jgi:hypothetical protein